MDLHGEIMNIRRDEPRDSFDDLSELTAYRMGHRDARHAAAELAIALDAKYAALQSSHRELLAEAKEFVRQYGCECMHPACRHCSDSILLESAIRNAEALGGE